MYSTCVSRNVWTETLVLRAACLSHLPTLRSAIAKGRKRLAKRRDSMGSNNEGDELTCAWCLQGARKVPASLFP